MDLVIPGDVLGTEEEVLPGNGTELEDGEVVSTVIGIPVHRNRSIHVKSVNQPTFITKYMKVVGRVESTTESAAIVSCLPLNNLSKKSNILRSGMKFIAGLHISKISRSHIKSIKDGVRIGDIIRGTVINVDLRKNVVDISTQAPEDGVIIGYCSVCRTKLNLLKRGVLKCPKCGNVEHRKTSVLYGRTDLFIKTR